MPFLPIFSDRFKQLRVTYDLSLADIALFLNLNSNVVPSKWELQKNWPSTEALISISRLFGVSTDWLLGNTDQPYNEALLETIEDELIHSVVYFGNSHQSIFNQTGFPEVYYNPNLRKINYSMPVRANIIFFMNHEAAFTSYSHHHTSHPNTPPTTTLKLNFCRSYSDECICQKARKRNMLYTDNLLKLLRDTSDAIPVYNLNR